MDLFAIFLGFVGSLTSCFLVGLLEYVEIYVFFFTLCVYKYVYVMKQHVCL